MREVAPTRSAVIELAEERRAMREGYAFLDEKCLLLAGEMVLELRRYESLRSDVERLQVEARAALRDAVGRHGLQGLQVYPAGDLGAAELRRAERQLMGVALQEVGLEGAPAPARAPVNPSPEAEACRQRFGELLSQAARLAAATGNLERLWLEYRRSSRRARALQDVLLPELERTILEVGTHLEELEQEDAVSMRRGADMAQRSPQR